MTVDALLLRFEAPLMSFGGTVVDQINATRHHPGKAMLAGLLGNALGYRHGDAAALAALQQRLRWAAREDQPGRPFVDFQTVNLSEPFMWQGWTTRGQPEVRAAKYRRRDVGTTIRYRHYLADAVYLVALGLAEGDGPDLDALDAAVQRPARPLFLGRKCCIPSSPLRVGRVSTPRLRDALLHPAAARIERRTSARQATAPTRVRAWWPTDEGTEIGRTIAFTDDMDWENQLHVGRRYVQEAWVEFEPAPAEAQAS
jgi:CRISPR system Cascade subunit CasD